MSSPRHLLITRPVPALWLHTLSHAGCRLHAMPFVETLPLTDDHVCQQVQHWATQRVMALFTSPRAVAAVAACLGAGTPPPWQVACVGPATAAAVQHQWPGLPVVCVAHDAASLAEAAIPLAPALPVVHFCSKQRLPVLAAAFAAHHRPLQTVAVYQTVQQPQCLTRHFDAVLFCSPSAVNSFFSANTVPAATTLLAMGATTAAAVQQASGRAAQVLPAQSVQQFIQLAVAHMSATAYSAQRS
jgi:uroporphyrinogen-III synthase